DLLDERCDVLRLAFALSAAVILVLLAGTGVSVFFAVEAQYRADQEEGARRSAEEQRLVAQNKEKQANRNLQRALAAEAEAKTQAEKARGNFKMAQDAVDRFYTRVSQDKLLN